MELDRYRPILNNGVCPGATPESARAEVEWYKKCGYGGFAINGGTREPIDDLKDWLSGYMQACRYYVQAAKELGMNVWIFDEWGYPSGTACGQVLTEERFRAKKYRLSYDIILEAGQSICLPLPDKFVSACAFPVDYFSFYCNQLSSERIYPQDGQLCYTAGQRTRVIAVAWEYTTFITHTMPKNKVDESTVGTIDILSKEAVAKFLRCMHEWYVEPLGDEFGKTIQGFFYDEPELCYDFPYTEELPEAFLKRFGYPVEDILPELLGWKFRSALVSGASSRLVSDSSAGAQLCRNMADYEAVWTDLLARNFYGQIQEWCHAHGLLSVGHQDLDNQLSTLRTVSGDFWENNKYNDRPGIDVIWDNIAPDKFADFARYAGCAKRTFGTSGAISETFAEMGPSMYPDRMRYTMEQQILRGVDQFFLYVNHDRSDLNVQNFAAEVNDRVTRTAQLCNLGNPGAKTAIYVPMDEIAFFSGYGDPHLHNTDPQAWQRVDALAQAMCYHPMDYDYVWQGTVDTLRQRGVSTLLLPGVQAFGEAELADIRAFAQAGGTVVSVFKPCVELEDVSAFFTTPALWLAQKPAEAIVLRGLDGVSPRISLSSRLLEGDVLYFLLNESDEPSRVAVCAVDGAWQMLEQNSGEWLPADLTAPLAFHARELKIFRYTPGKEAQKPLQRSESTVLDGWCFTGPEGEPQQLEVLVPWAQLGLGDYTGVACYETRFDWAGGLCEIDLGEVRFAALVELDGEEIRLPMAPYRFVRQLEAGQHTLCIRVLNSNANRLYSGEDRGRSNFKGHYWMQYQFERAYRECGLLGPVTVTELQ